MKIRTLLAALVISWAAYGAQVTEQKTPTTGGGSVTATGAQTLANKKMLENMRVVTAAGAVTMSTTDYDVCVNKTVGAATAVNLPATPVTGNSYQIADCKGDSATNNITITPAAGTISGASTAVVNINYGAWTGFYNGTSWVTVTSNVASGGGITALTGVVTGTGPGSTATSFGSSTGSGAVVLATSPTLVTPALGTPASGVATNLTGLPPGGALSTVGSKLAIGGTSDDTAAVQAVIATLSNGDTLNFQPGVTYKFNASGINFTGFTGITVNFNGANIQALADTTQYIGAASFPDVVWIASCTNCLIENGNFNGEGFRGGFIGMSGSTDTTILNNTSTNVGRSGDFTSNQQFGSIASTREVWELNTAYAAGSINIFNGTASTSGASTTLTIASTVTGSLAVGNSIRGSGITGGTTITAFGTYTVLAGTGTVTLSQSATVSSATPVNTAPGVRGYWLSGTQTGQGALDMIVRNNKAVGNTATGFVFGGAGSQVIGNYAYNNAGSGFITESGTGGLQGKNQLFAGNTAVANAFWGYQTDTASDQILGATITGNRFANSGNGCILLQYAVNFTITGNDCINNDTLATAQPAIEILISSLISITGNNIVIATGTDAADGITTVGAGNTVSDLTISSNTISSANTGYAIRVTATGASSSISRVAVDGNIISGGLTGVRAYADTAGGVMAGISIVGNTVTGISSHSFEMLSATNGQITGLKLIGNSGTSSSFGASIVFQANSGNDWNGSAATLTLASDTTTTSSTLAMNGTIPVITIQGAGHSGQQWQFGPDGAYGDARFYSYTNAGAGIQMMEFEPNSNFMSFGPAGTMAFYFDGTGPIHYGGSHYDYAGTAPAISACGTGSPAADAHATDASGTVTAGGGVLASCTVTFHAAYSTWNHCVVTPEAADAGFAYSYTKSVLTVTATSLTSEVFDYRCDGS
jgi:hypothetical protein